MRRGKLQTIPKTVSLSAGSKTKYNTIMAPKTPTFNARVYDIVRLIPCGKVLSYGKIARLTGNPRASRAVGYAVASPYAPKLPYHRVVYKDGSLSPAFIVKGQNRQYTLLKQENVSFTKDRRVQMKKHEWRADGVSLKLFNKYGL